MDHALTREESVKLMQLLKLPMEQYGNFPLMRRAFLEQCKVLHPDKGGNAELAKELISLYRKLEAVIPPLNPNDSFTTEQVGVSDSFVFYLRDWSSCLKGTEVCICLFCLLRDSHRRRGSKPKCWGSCFCFECYIAWFGLEYTYFIAQSWQAIIAKLPFSTLNI
ncbi:small T antigen [Polyomavirus sp.]|uniref:small T antigen n=1 Tax=Polyomavirus sp. TaxID=36362 RepID=UPI0008DBD207|nr:small T antigen [Polyomavirus sp.]AOW44160.1 small T antigen [Polyomavirus sp.]